MAIMIDDPQTEQLAQRIATAEGVSVEEVVRESLFSLAGRRGLAADRRPLRERLAALAREVDAVPTPPSSRATDDEILGYDEHGVW